MSALKSSWKNFLLSNPEFEASNNHIPQILSLSDPALPFKDMFDEISKNHGISLISFDPSESEIQLFHHNQIVGGSWENPKKVLASIRGFDNSTCPVQIVLKSIKIIKTKTPSFAPVINPALVQNHDNNNPLENLDTSKSAKKIEFYQRNIIPIPHLLTKAFLNLSKFDPLSVAQVFYETMREFDLKNQDNNQEEKIPSDKDDYTTGKNTQDTNMENEDNQKEETEPDLFEEQERDAAKTTEDAEDETIPHYEKHPPKDTLLSSFLHVLQFCYLCANQKIPPVHYSIVTNAAIDCWFNRLDSIKGSCSTISTKRRSSIMLNSPESEDSIVSPDQKISRKDQYFIHTLLKIHDTMDKSYKEKSEKEPGFARLEDHRKNLILNASALPPYNWKAKKPTEFYSTFLAKKSQFKAKDMLVHQLHSEKISFNPSSTFVNNLWNCEFFWLLPDSPSGVSIFFCPETKSSNASDIEKERLLALADKVNISDVEKLSKQKLYLPTSVMDLVWMTQNLHAVLKLCFGPSSTQQHS